LDKLGNGNNPLKACKEEYLKKEAGIGSSQNLTI
jgi:hypothetical protein